MRTPLKKIASSGKKNAFVVQRRGLLIGSSAIFCATERNVEPRLRVLCPKIYSIMGVKMPIQFESTCSDVVRSFSHPEDIGASRELSAEQKVKLLQEWEYDLRLMQVAADENMIASQSTGALELFGRIRACLNELGVPPSEEQGVGPKTG
jgi:hypothetical protein